MLLYVFLSPASGMPRADQLCVVFESRRNGFGAVGIALDEFDHVGFLLALTPNLKGIDVGEAEGVTVLVVAGTIRLL
jgi:hypothetical protein